MSVGISFSSIWYKSLYFSEISIPSYFNDSKKLETTSGGIEVTGTITIGSAGISEAELEILDGATVTTDELNKLNQLLKDGVLTEEEFQKAKKKILDN